MLGPSQGRTCIYSPSPIITLLVGRKSTGRIQRTGPQQNGKPTPPTPPQKGGVYSQVQGGISPHPAQEGGTPGQNSAPSHWDATFNQLGASAQGGSMSY